MNRIAWQDVSPHAPLHVARTEINTGYSHELHDHDFAEFFYVVSGHGQHVLTSCEQHLRPGDLVFLHPAHAHGFRAESMQIINVAFDWQLIESLVEACAELSRLFGQEQPMQLRSSSLQRERLFYWIEALQPASSDALTVIALLADIARSVSAQRKDDDAPLWLKESLLQMQEPPLLTEGMHALIRLSERSREYVWRMCKKHYAKRPQDLINEMRMDYAERKLRLSDEQIIHICYDCGLSNLSHFYKLFQKKYDMTPKRYRQHHRQIAI